MNQSCPKGTFGPLPGLKTVDECTDCLPGKYCSEKGKTNVTGNCAAGYWCKRNAVQMDPPTDDPDGKFGPCPTGGYYCPEESSDKRPCRRGRYAKPNMQKLTSADDCLLCEAGHYCAEGNQTSVSGKCHAGYYCEQGSDTATPINQTYGDVCPVATYCPNGTDVPIQCDAGTFNDKVKQSECQNCTAGHYCPSNSSSQIPCPPGYWCEDMAERADKYACPIGTFNNLTGRSSESDCINCTAGFYCDTTGQSRSIVTSFNTFVLFVQILIIFLICLEHTASEDRISC